MKKRYFLRTVCFALLLSLLLATPVCAASMGSQLYDSQISLAGQAQLAKGVYWSSGYNDYVTENYLLLQPGGSVAAVVGYGNDLYGAASLKTAVNVLTNRGYSVLAGLNADFFNTSTGVPVGMVMFNGEILSSESNGWETIGFKRDGSVIMGEPKITYKLTGNFGTLSINKINKEMSKSSGLTLYTKVYSTTTRASVSTYNVVMDIESGKLSVGGQLQGRVVAVGASSSPRALAEGQAVLSLAQEGSASALASLKKIAVGDVLTVSVSNSSAWGDVVYACGGSERLLRAGKNVASNSTAAPRTALGVKSNGNVVFYTVDGRQKGLSAGATLKEVAQRLLELGCVDAVNLDGGGSTTLAALLPGNAYGQLQLINSPSGGSLRSCGDYLFLVNQGQAVGGLSHLHIYPYNMLVLAGSSIPLTVKGSDANYYPVTLPGEPFLDVNPEAGVCDGGRFIAGNAAASGQINASLAEAAGSTNVRVINAPEKITVYKEGDLSKAVTALAVNGNDSVSLTARAKYQTQILQSSDNAFQWKVNGPIGSIDQNGSFTPSPYGGVGSITVSYGAKTVTINVTVAASITVVDGTVQILDGFENGSAVSAAAGITPRDNGNKAYVKYGAHSLALDYNLGGNTAVLSAPANYTLSGDDPYLDFWLYGDKSANQLTVTFATAAGAEEIVASVVNFKGWQSVAVPIPGDCYGVTAFSVRGTGKGTVYIDQLMSSSVPVMDKQGPKITVDGFSGGQLAATIQDDRSGGLDSKDIRVTVDGKAQAFNFQPAGGTLSATVAISDPYAHIISIQAADASGNLTKASHYVAASQTEDIFSDIQGHWAKPYAEYLFHQGIISGIITDAGLTYQANAPLTRAQFAVIVANWQGIDGAAYAGADMPFADKASIPDWAYNQVKAMYTLGVISGYGSGNDLKFKPNSNITRAEAMTMIGRIQERGFAETELKFSDAASVGDWALPFVKTLTAQGVISGYNNKIMPGQSITRGEIAKIIYSLL
ncbi:MAG: S-layer homology domain-containing protein [Firmicutes bacterium]|nr:S-layer homology domain-containing protein [Bacillota bacterium]